MTGPEHYREAEDLLATLAIDDHGNVSFGEGGEAFVAAAQVHATLALAAATAVAPIEGVGDAGWQDWQRVAGHHARAGDDR